MIFSIFLLACFVIIYSTQSTRVADRIYLNIRIDRGLLSNRDIVNISCQQWSDRMYDTSWSIQGKILRSLRLNLSKTGRIYQVEYVGDHKTVHYIKRRTALLYVKIDNRRQSDRLYRHVNPKSNYSPIFQNLIIRPEAV